MKGDPKGFEAKGRGLDQRYQANETRTPTHISRNIWQNVIKR
jgi:hypothetical protein